jgi:hypothetical protein
LAVSVESDCFKKVKGKREKRVGQGEETSPSATT